MADSETGKTHNWVQIQNPTTGQWHLVDKQNGAIHAVRDKPWINVPVGKLTSKAILLNGH